MTSLLEFLFSVVCRDNIKVPITLNTKYCDVQLRGWPKSRKNVAGVCEVMGSACVFSVFQHVVGGNSPVVVARPVLGAQSSHRPELLLQRVPGPASHAGATCRSKHVSLKGKRSIYTSLSQSAAETLLVEEIRNRKLYM